MDTVEVKEYQYTLYTDGCIGRKGIPGHTLYRWIKWKVNARTHLVQKDTVKGKQGIPEHTLYR